MNDEHLNHGGIGGSRVAIEVAIPDPQPCLTTSLHVLALNMYSTKELQLLGFYLMSVGTQYNLKMRYEKF